MLLNVFNQLQVHINQIYQYMLLQILIILKKHLLISINLKLKIKIYKLITNHLKHQWLIDFHMHDI